MKAKDDITHIRKMYDTILEQGIIIGRPVDQNIFCRGCYALGTACGQCKRCQDEQQKIVDDFVRTWKQ